MTSEPQIEKALNRAEEYLAGRQCRNGGFCFYRSEYLEEPNLHDTYHALASLHLLQRPFPNRESIIAYLMEQPHRSYQPYFLFYYVLSMQLLGLPQNPDTLSDIANLSLNTSPSQTGFSGWLSTALKVVRLMQDYARNTPAQEVVAHIMKLHREGGFGIKPNLEDTWLALALLSRLGVNIRDENIVGFIDDMQVPSIGFRNTRDSLYTNANILQAGVFSCILLGIPVRYPEVIVNMVLSSQCRNGAFAAVPDSLPNLETHYVALTLVKALTGDAGLAEPSAAILDIPAGHRGGNAVRTHETGS